MSKRMCVRRVDHRMRGVGEARNEGGIRKLIGDSLVEIGTLGRLDRGDIWRVEVDLMADDGVGCGLRIVDFSRMEVLVAASHLSDTVRSQSVPRGRGQGSARLHSTYPREAQGHSDS